MSNLNDTQKSIIYYLITHQQASHEELSRVVHISKPGITLATKALVNSKMVLKSNPAKPGQVGRRVEYLSLNPDYGAFIGVDYRKHYFYLSAVSFNGALLGETKKCLDLKELVDSIWDVFKVCPNVLGMAVTIRDFIALDRYRKEHDEFVALMESFRIPVLFLSNVEALSYVHKLYYPEDQTFLLVKYGPTIGGSVFAHGLPVGHPSLFGRMYVGEKHLEDIISFEALLGEDYEEQEGAKLLLQDESKLQSAMHALAMGLLTADHLLNLDRVIFAGVVLNDAKAQSILRKELLSLEADAPVNKATLYQNYASLNERKAALMALIRFSSKDENLIRGN